MQHELVLTRTAVDRVLNGRRSGTAGSPVVCSAGMDRSGDRLRWLVHDVSGGIRFGRSQVARCVIGVAADRDRIGRTLADLTVRWSASAPTVYLVLGVEGAAGDLAATCRSQDSADTVSSLTIVGPGMPHITLNSDQGRSDSENRGRIIRAASAEPSLRIPELWSRTIGALGEAIWQRLTDLRVGLVGCGRSGSLMAGALRRIGVSSLTLVDPDRLEPHNLGEMDGVGPGDLNLRKVHAVNRFLEHEDLLTGGPAVMVADSVLALSALAAVKNADLLICCVDNALARLAANFLATLYLKPFVDVGVGIFHAHGSSAASPAAEQDHAPAHRVMGADVRLILPGDRRCLLCLGGLAHAEQARREFLATGEGGHTVQPPDWRQQRAGSLRSLNCLATALAQRLLEDFIGSRVANSTWLHLDYSDEGIPTIEHRQPPAASACPLCALCGSGDAGLGQLSAVVRSLDEAPASDPR